MDRFARNPAPRGAVRAAAVSVVALGLGACSTGSIGDLWNAEGTGTAQRQAYEELKSSQAALMRIGDSTFEAGDADTAAQFYHRAALADPSRAVPFFKLGQALAALGAHDKAEVAYRRALEADSGHAEARYGLGKALMSLGRPEEAAETLRRVVTEEGSSRAYNALGVALDLAGDRSAAQEVYRTGLDEIPGDLTLMNNLGLSLALDGQHDEALALLTEVVAKAEAGPRHRQNLALALGLAGRPEQAAQIGRHDLAEREIQNNLAYYRWLRTQPAAAVAGALTMARQEETLPPNAAAQLPATPAIPVLESEVN